MSLNIIYIFHFIFMLIYCLYCFTFEGKLIILFYSKNFCLQYLEFSQKCKTSFFLSTATKNNIAHRA